MRLLTAAAALLVIAAPAMAKDFVPFASSLSSSAPTAADLVLEYDGGVFRGYGTSPGWTDLTVVNFEAPDGGPWVLCEALYYVHGVEDKPAQVWDVAALAAPPVAIADESISWLPDSAVYPPGAFQAVDVTGYGLSYATGDLFGVGTTFNGLGDGIGLADADADGVLGHSWAIYGGFWTDDTNGYNTDDGIRAGICESGPTPTSETTWGAMKDLFSN
ncbi:MAG: hypothetical protein ACYTFT_17370 [Planctomycetota bacterium]|jgi:hypothetical protein